MKPVSLATVLPRCAASAPFSLLSRGRLAARSSIWLVAGLAIACSSEGGGGGGVGGLTSDSTVGGSVGDAGGLGGSSPTTGGSSTVYGMSGVTTTASGGPLSGGSTTFGGTSAEGSTSGGATSGGSTSGGATSGGSTSGGAGTTGGMTGAGGASAGVGGSSSGGSEPGACPEGAPVPTSELLSSCTTQGDNIECVFGGDPGYYQLSVLLGGPGAADAEVEVESRRAVIGKAAVEAGATRCVSTTVQVRQPEGQPRQDVDPGTPGLNLFMEGNAGALQGVAVTPADPIVLYIAGDSTVCDQSPQRQASPQSRFSGWGQALPQFFDERVAVANYADSGEGTQSYRVDGGSLWQPIGSNIKEGDFLFIQLGHNDKNTSAATYRSRITGMVRAATDAGASVVLVSPMIRNNGDALERQHIYGDLNVREELIGISEAESVPFVDLMQITAEWAAELGPSAAQGYYTNDDKTHSNALGAQLFAEFIVDSMVEQDLPITEYLR